MLPQEPDADAPRWALPGYDLGHLLGFGATGEVWQARELASGELVALKRLRPGAGPDGAARLRREAAALAGLVHPHVLRLRSVLGSGEEVVLVLDLAVGGSLAALLAARGRLDAGEVVTVAAPLAQALAAAHDLGLLHGDVTPANVLFTADGRPLLADLGVAGAVGESGPVVATAEYLDPHVAAGGTRSPASDVHGLAACAYHALTGRPLFEGASATATLAAAAEGAHPPLALLAPEVPSELAGLLERALDPDPSRRPTAQALARGLFEATPAAPVRLTDGAPLLVSAPLTHDVVAPAAPVPLGAPRPWWRAGGRAAGIAAAVVVAVAVGALATTLGVRALSPPEVAEVRTSPTVAAAPSSAPTVEAPPTPDGVDLTDPAADPTAVHGALSARRDAAVAAGDAAALAGAYTADSPARTADERLVAALAERGARAEGFAHVVVAVVVVERDERRLLLTVTDTLPGYRVVGADGAVLAEQPGRGEEVQQVELVLTPDGWRIASLTA